MKNLVCLFLFLIIIDISIGKKLLKTTAFRFQQQEQNGLSNANGMDDAPFMKLFMKSPQELLKHYQLIHSDDQRFVSTNQTQFQTFFGGLSQEKVYEQISHMTPKDVQLSQSSAMRFASRDKRSPDTFFWQVKDYSSNKIPYENVVASDTYNSPECQPEWSLHDDKHQSWFSHWFFQKDISHVTVEYSFNHAQKVKAIQIWFVKPPGEFKTEYSPDGSEWFVFKKNEADNNDWRIGLNEKEQKERKQGKFFTDYLWDTNIVGNTFVDEFPQLTTVLKVRYTLRSPVMWHYGIWYAAAFTDIYTGQIKSLIKGTQDLCLTVNSGYVPEIEKNIGQNLVTDNCLDVLLLNDARDIFVFTPDHKIRSYYNQQLCLEGALNEESITLEDCNTSHKKFQTWHLSHKGQLRWHDSTKCMFITGDETALQKQVGVIINCTSTFQDNQHEPDMMIDGSELTWWMSEENVEQVTVEMIFPHVKKVKKIRIFFKFTVKAFVIDGQYKDGQLKFYLNNQ